MATETKLGTLSTLSIGLGGMVGGGITTGAANILMSVAPTADAPTPPDPGAG